MSHLEENKIIARRWLELINEPKTVSLAVETAAIQPRTRLRGLANV